MIRPLLIVCLLLIRRRVCRLFALCLRVCYVGKHTGISLCNAFDVLPGIILLTVFCKHILIIVREQFFHALCDYLLEIYGVVLAHITGRTRSCLFILHQMQAVAVLSRRSLFLSLGIILFGFIVWIDQISIFIINLLDIKCPGITVILICTLVVA